MNKDKRQKRFLQKDRHIDRQLHLAKVADHHFYNDNNRHRLHKMKALDCGVAGCPMCSNPRYVWGQKTMQERKFEAISIDD